MPRNLLVKFIRSQHVYVISGGKGHSDTAYEDSIVRQHAVTGMSVADF